MSNKATNSVRIALVLAGLAMGSGVQAADVFAEPLLTKSGGSGYALTVFPAAGEEGVSFNLQLPVGMKGVDLSKCGGAQADGFASCLYSPESGKMNVVLFRLDGKALTQREYSLGQVMLPANVARQKLGAVEPENVVGASRKTKAIESAR
ncbi:MAG: hypothetical protein WCZ65_04345 [Lysobacteraceae bacterium]